MNNQEQKISQVTQLKNFPFKTFQEFKIAITDGAAKTGVDRGAALHWGTRGIYASRSLRFQTFFLMFLPLIAGLGFVIWSIFSQNWTMLLTLPVLFIAFIMFHPSAAYTLGILRSGLIGLSFTGVLYGFLKNRSSLMVLSLTLVIIWYSQNHAYKKSVQYLNQAVTIHEDLLCILWQVKALHIRFPNGNIYSVNWKTENEKTTYFDKLGIPV